MKSLTFTRGAVLTGALMLSHAASALAAGQGENTPLNLGNSAPTVHSASGTGTSVMRTIIGLLIVVAVIYGISWFLRRSKNRASGRVQGTSLSSIASLPLGPGRSVQLVRAGHELLLLGVAEQGVTTIRRYTEAEAIEAGLDLDEEEPHWSDPLERPRGGLLETVRRLTVRS